MHAQQPISSDSIRIIFQILIDWLPLGNFEFYYDDVSVIADADAVVAFLIDANYKLDNDVAASISVQFKISSHPNYATMGEHDWWLVKRELGSHRAWNADFWIIVITSK